MKHARLFLFVIAATLAAGLLWHAFNQSNDPSNTVHLSKVPDAPPITPSAVETPEPAEPVRLAQDLEPFETAQVGDAGPVSLKVTPLTGGAMSIKLHTPGFQAINVEQGLVLRLQDGQLNTDKDALSGPDMPAVVQTYPGVEGMRPVVRILATESVAHEGIDVAPRVSWHRDEETDEWFEARFPDQNIFGVDASWPASIVDVQEIKARDSHVVRLAYRPLQYNPVSGTITRHKVIDSVLEFVPMEQKSNVEFSSSATVVADECDCGGRITLEEDLLPPMNGDPSDFASRWSGEASGACVKIRVTEQGIHRLTRANLVSAGVAASDLVGANIRMYTRDREIPIFVSKSGAFGASDYIDFYGEGIRSNYDHENAYWLGFGGPGSPARFSDADHNIPGSAPITGAPTVASACRQVDLDPGTDGEWNAVLNHSDREFDGWNTALIQESTLLGLFNDYKWSVPHMNNTDTSRDASISVYWRPRTVIGGTTHRMDIRNGGTGNLLTTHSFPRPTQVTSGVRVSTTFSSSLLTRTASGTQVQFKGQEGNLAYVDNATLKFYRQLYAISNRLGFSGKAGANNYIVNNITSLSGTPYVLDISDPTDPKRLSGVTETGSTIRFGYQPSSDPCLFVSTQNAVRTVPSSKIETVTLHNLADKRRQADYVLIVPEPFEGNIANDLLNHRAKDNLNVLVATAESIYNEFGYGLKDAQAIKQFIGYAYHHFQEPKPKYFLFAGDAFKDSTSGYTDTYPDFIPSKYQRTSFVFTATDQWFGVIDGPDLAPDVAIGRLPVNDIAQFQNLVNKMKTFEAYGQPAWRKSIQLVADETDQKGGVIRTCSPADYPRICQDYFMVQNELDQTVIPNTIVSSKSYLQSNGGNVFTVNNQVKSSFNDGRFAINYIGHGSKGKWGLQNYPEAMFDSGDADILANSRLPLVTIFTCLNGQFHLPDEASSHCCVERMIWRPNQGAAGAIAPTGLAQTLAGRTLCLEFYNAIYNDRLAQGICDPTQPPGQQYQLTGYQQSSTGTSRIGDCLLNGFNAVCYVLGEQEELKFYHLFMDPATKHGF